MNHSFQWKSKSNSLEILLNIISVMMYSKTGCPLAVQCASPESLLKQQRLDTEHTFEQTRRTSSCVLRLVQNVKYAELLKLILLY